MRRGGLTQRTSDAEAFILITNVACQLAEDRSCFFVQSVAGHALNIHVPTKEEGTERMIVVSLCLKSFWHINVELLLHNASSLVAESAFLFIVDDM